ncbi:MAG: hypothetical protein V7651_11835 [Hyphomonas oceanitis]|uniref:hypothetical protein n=1 Tax=Hyphomonas oceanitis TaxID=81033 RepID=UPI0030033553
MALEELEHELLPEALPAAEAISLRAAVAWLAGLPKGDLDDFDTSKPSHRLGRTEQSKRFWLRVFDHLASRDEGLDTNLDWHGMIFHDAVRQIPADSRRAQTERRIFSAARRYLDSGGRSAAEMSSEWSESLKNEIGRIWVIRDALGLISEHIGTLLCDQNAAEELRRRVDSQPRDATGYCVSLRTNSLDLVRWPEHEGTRFVELWRETKSAQFRTQLKADVALKRSELVRLFVIEPDQDRDNWISAKLDQPFWPISVALMFVAFNGQMEQVYKTVQSLSTHGYSETNVTLDRIAIWTVSDDEDDDVGVPAASCLIRKMLQSAKLEARGVRAHDSFEGKIDAASWQFLDLKSNWHPAFISAEDTSGRTSISWQHVLIDSLQLRSLIIPELPHAALPNERSFAFQVPRDTPEKRRLWELVAYLESQVANSRYSTHRRDAILERLLPETSPNERNRLWHAAQLLLPEPIAEQWALPGKKRSIDS